MFRVTSALVTLVGTFACCGAVRAEVVIETVTVGNPGNANDTHGLGRVDYVYNIGTFEVTAGQYTEFLNAVAASDPYGLYNVNMGSGYGGITRSGSAGSYTYSPITGRGNMPVNYVSWYDTLRFANWMHNGQPMGAQGPSTTEDGAYDMSRGSGVVRKPGARVFLPTEDEWYKAAYYKGAGTMRAIGPFPHSRTRPRWPKACQAPIFSTARRTTRG